MGEEVSISGLRSHSSRDSAPNSNLAVPLTQQRGPCLHSPSRPPFCFAISPRFALSLALTSTGISLQFLCHQARFTWPTSKQSHTTPVAADPLTSNPLFSLVTHSAGNPLNRLSYLRSSAAFLASALESDKSQFVVYDSLNPLVAAPLADGTKKLLLLKYEDLKQYIVGEEGSAQELFKGVDGKEELELGRVPSFIKPEGGKAIAELSAAEKRHVFINLVSLLLSLTFRRAG